MSLAPGTLVTDRIRLERLLGEGGMGSVWIAQHLTLDAKVAVKFVTPELAAKHPELKERFLREAAAAAKINSPHVVRTFDFGAMSDGTPFLVMELLEGESLLDRLQREGCLPPPDAALIIGQVAKALSEAHRLGVVHRDIKPGNIFLTRAGRDLFAKVLDFGIAKDIEKVTSNATKTGLALGTPQYMSPEQLMSAKTVDFQADLWALSVTAYEAVVGGPPFVGETVPRLIVSIYGGQFDPPSRARRPPIVGDSAALDAFFARSFASDTAKRFSSALDLADAFAVVCGASGSAPASAAAVRTTYGAPVDDHSAKAEPPARASEPALRTEYGAPLDDSVAAPHTLTAQSADPAETTSPDAHDAQAVDPGATKLGEPIREGATEMRSTKLAEPARAGATKLGATKVAAGAQPAGATEHGAGKAGVTKIARSIPRPPSDQLAPARSPNTTYAIAAAGALVLGAVVWAATRSGDTGDGATVKGSAESASTARASESAPPTATVTQTPVSASAPPPSDGLVVVRVEEGASAAAGAWFPAFTARTTSSPESSLPRAYAACTEQGRYLCSEPQWLAACALNPELARVSAWTASSEQVRGVVRGGASCDERKLAGTTAKHAVTCCDRAVGVVGDPETFLRAASKKIGEYERVMNSRSAADLARLFYADEVDFLEKRMSKETLEKQGTGYFKMNPDLSMVYGKCAVRAHAELDGWRAVCPTMIYRGGKLWGVDESLTFGETSGKLTRLSQANSVRLE